MNSVEKLAVIVVTALAGLVTTASDSRELFNGRDLTGWYKRFGTDLERMSYNNPTATVDLENGIWTFPYVFDWDGDGSDDILLATGSKPYHDSLLYRRNVAKGGMDGLLMDRGVVVDRVFHANGMQSEYAGRTVLMKPGYIAWNPQRQAPFDFTKLLPPGGRFMPHFRGLVGASWCFADLDGDGREDIVASVGDWSDYGRPGPGCPAAYDAKGNWTNDQLQVYMYWFRNKGGEAPDLELEPAQPLLCDGKPLFKGPWGRPSPMIHDWDGDGDLDIICGEFVDSFWYFENIGTAKEAKFAAARKVLSTDGGQLAVELCMFAPTKADWNGDGRMDIIASEEDGRTAFYENTGKMKDGAPLFKPGVYLKQPAANLKFGCLATPYGVDWDGDGDMDLICGNSSGKIAFFENLSGAGVARPKWAPPKMLTVGGRPIRTMAGWSGSPQGPVERKWGYSVVTVGDWDGDGWLDVMANDINGDVVWYRNPGRHGALEMEPARAVEVEWDGSAPYPDWHWRRPDGKKLLAPWRTSPVVYDWNGDGLLDLVMLDSEGYLALYERTKSAAGQLLLKAPQRVFADHVGKPLLLAAAKAGGSGRRKICITDWNGDGKPDLIINNWNAMVYENVGTMDGVTRFKAYNSVARYQLSGHTTCPTAVDFDGNGIPDLVIGAEDGHFYYLENPRSANARQPDQQTLLKEEREFDGRTRFHLPQSEALVPSCGDFAISMEVRCGDAARWGEQHLFSSHAPVQWRGVGGMGSLGLNFEGKDRGRPYFYYRLGVLLKAKTDITDDKWHVLTLTRKANAFSLAVDGRIEATATCADSFYPIEGWALGANAYIEDKDVGNFYRGWMRNVRLLQHAEDAAAVGVKTLARRGEKSEYSIVLPPDPSPSQDYAAKQLRFILEKLTGVYLPIVADGDFKGGKAVYLGRDPGGTDDLGTDGNRLVVRGDDLYVVGSPVRGTLYGVYELLETYGDAGWYEWDCVHYPRQNSFAVPADLDWTDLPTLMMRDPCGWESIHNPDIAAYWRFNGAGNGHPHAPKAPAHLGGCSYWFPKGNSAAHTFLSLVPPKKYFATHPEYFSEINGVRRNGITQLCLTNPDVLRIATEEILRMLDAEPKVEFVGVSADDWKYNCTCKDCKAIDDYEESPAGTLIRFVNAIAEEVEKKHPNVYVQTLAYLHTRKAPKYVRPRHNVVPALCPIECDFGHPLKTGELPNNVNFRKDMDAWAAITDKLYIWDYVTNFGWFMGAQPNIFVMQENMKYFRDNRTAFLYADGPSFNAEFSALKSYLVAKWAWNPDLSADRLIDRFLTGSYGEAAPYVREYIDLVQDVAKRHPRHFFGCFSSVHPEFSSAAFADKSRDLWSKAEQAVAGNAAVLKRLRRAEFSPVAMRLDAAAAKTKYIWVTRHPETFTKPAGVDEDLAFAEARIEEFRKDGHPTVFGLPARAKERSIYGGWRRAAEFTRPKEGCDRVFVGLDDLTVYHEDWGKIVDDPTAFQGKAYLSHNTQDLLTLLIRFRNVAYDPGARYAVRVRVRAELEQGATGEVFCATLGKMEKAVTATEVRDGQWHWYDVGSAELSDALEFQFRPGRFAKGGGRNTVRNLYVDQVEIARVAGD